VALFGQETQRLFIARPDSAKGQLVYKWPDTNIRKLTQLTVEQDELAVFFRDGKVQGTIQPGRCTLDSSEIPFLGILVDATTGGNFFKTELYFITTREFPSLPFGGTVDNVVDPQTSLGVGLRVFGDYSLKAIEPQSLIVNLVGTQQLQTNDQVTNWMRDQVLKVLRTDVVAHITQSGWPLLGIAGHTDEIEQDTISKVQAFVAPYGVQIIRLGNFTISIKPEDEDRLKTYLKDAQYTKLAGGFTAYGAGEAMIGAGQGLAKGPGQGGGLNPAFLGVGLGMAGLVNQQANQAMQQPAPPPVPAPAPATVVEVRCLKCNALNPETAKFCANCGGPLTMAAGAGGS
jgi:membrane protease subunit (stomatin/prohibitin family)